MKGKCFLLFLFLLAVPSALALCEGSSFEDAFDYPGTFAGQGYTYINSCGFSCEKSTPITSPFSTNAFGYNSTDGSCGVCSFANTREIRKSLGINFTDGVIYSFFDLEKIKFESYPSVSGDFIIGFGNTSTTANKLSLYVNRNDNLNNSLIYALVEDETGQDCMQGTNISSINYSISLEVIIDIPSHKYTIIVNNTPYCVDYSLGTNHLFFVGAVGMSESIPASKNVSLFLDNVQICTDFLGNVTRELGMPCTTGGDCDTGKCDYGICVQKVGNEPCDENSDCISQRCVGNKCVKPSFAKLLNAGVKEQFGDDTESLTIISIILMIGLPTAIIIGASVLKSGALAYFGIAVFIILGFAFTLIGWLNPFITLGIVVVALIIMVLVWLMKSQ